MTLIVGLGNPGAKYLMTRHNIGFLALDVFAKSIGSPPSKEEHKAITSKFQFEGKPVLLAKPKTFMNLSGESVQSLMHFYKIEIADILVVHDDIDQAFGGVKFHQNRGAGGHNGIKSITELLGTQDYGRLKLGVGRPGHPEQDVASYVLENFSATEQPDLTDFLNVAADGIESFILNGLERSADRFNKKSFRDVQEA